VAIRAAELIERKRNGEELSDGEISELILGYTRGDVPDYQMAAWCMAVYFKGLSGRETHALTGAMISSGETLDLGAALGRRVVDKHSTGGVGDKTSLAVGPIIAACGVPFGKMSGRGQLFVTCLATSRAFRCRRCGSTDYLRPSAARGGFGRCGSLLSRANASASSRYS